MHSTSYATNKMANFMLLVNTNKQRQNLPVAFHTFAVF